MNPIFPHPTFCSYRNARFWLYDFCMSDTLRDHIPFATSMGIGSFSYPVVTQPFSLCLPSHPNSVTIARLMFFMYAACSVD
jgi:hypothetical protein